MNLAHISEKYFSSLKPNEINNGNCFNWAIATYFNFAEDSRYTVSLYSLAETTRHGSHAFIKIDNLFYDAEATLGVPAWRYLPFIRLYENVRKVRIDNREIQLHSSLKEFVEFWNCFGSEKRIKRFLEKNYPEVVSDLLTIEFPF